MQKLHHGFLKSVNRKQVIIRYLLCLSILMLSAVPASAQEIPAGLSYETWDRMNSRWESYMSWATVEMKDGTTIEGQVTRVTDNQIILQLTRAIPMIPADPADYVTVSFSDIQSIRLIRGGHPYQGLILGMLAGAIPGAVTGLILAQGWTVVPAIVFGAITAGGGGWIGTIIQKANRKENFTSIYTPVQPELLDRMKKTALFRDSLPAGWNATPPVRPDIQSVEGLLSSSVKLRKAFPDNKWSLSVQTGLMTNNVRKKLQVWFMEPLWGPPDGYYETRIILQADLARRIGKRFEAGALFNIVPGDVGYAHFRQRNIDFGVDYYYVHLFHQSTYGLYAGYLLQPTDRFLTHRFRGSLQAGAVVSNIYEHFYYNWATLDNTQNGEKLTQTNYWKPGGFLRAKAEYFLIPGFSLTFGAQGFWIRRVQFEEREILPVTNYGPEYIPAHKLGFSSMQVTAGVSIHL